MSKNEGLNGADRLGVRWLDTAFDDEARLVTSETSSSTAPISVGAARQAAPSKAVSSHRTPKRTLIVLCLSMLSALSS